MANQEAESNGGAKSNWWGDYDRKQKNICGRSFNPAQSFNIYTDSLRKTWKSQKFPKSPKIFGDIPKSPKIQKFPNLSIFGDEIPKMATLMEP